MLLFGDIILATFDIKVGYFTFSHHIGQYTFQSHECFSISNPNIEFTDL